jgi:SAM-dependent methyltransferase
MNLLRSPIVRPLEEDWRETLERVARRRGWPTSQEASRLGALVAKLSAAYNAGDATGMRSQDALAARLGFSFARDAPKSAGAVRELVATGALTLPDERALRVLDLGAGLGASTWGVALALEAYRPGIRGRIEAVCADDDEDALSLATAIAEARQERGAIEVRLEPLRATVSRAARISKGPFDVVLIGQVLSELDASTEDGKLAVSLEVVRSALDVAARDGSVVIVEPALRDRTRRLHALRDAIVAEPGEKITVFAPCLHQAPCPARADERAWCHEDLGVDLPHWLVPVAKAAGLRWQGLTFSYLVLRKDRRTLRQESADSAALVRIVSEALVTKGKREAFVCGELDENGARMPGLVRAMRLDRDATDTNAAWKDVSRGDTLECVPPLDAGRPRIARDTSLHIRTPTRPPHA